jgi:thiamine-monophosphate kinase
VLALCGRQGWAAGGLAVLGRGFRSPRVLVEAYRRPEPPYDAGPVAATPARPR